MQTVAKKIYLADHDEAVADATIMILQRMGYAVRHMLDGSSVTTWADEKPDLLLLDIGLQGIDGYAVCRWIKNNPATRDIPVLLVSSGGQAREIVMASGADGFLSKPYEMNELIHTIDELINAA
jgi:DNA-binding response OmpR family regulator